VLPGSKKPRVAKRRLFLAFSLLAFSTMTKAIEEPVYEVVKTLGDVEVRQYAPYVVAEVLIDGPAEKAGNAAFPILAAYIFGKNKGERKFAMTAPVTQVAAPVRLEMTAPVTQRPAPGGYIVQFVLPRGVTLESAPEPVDERVQLREVPAGKVAAITFSGFWSVSNYTEHLEKVIAVLRAADLPWTGEPIYSRYNAPWSLWFLRRNEIWLTLR
jgi:hypothetical protein